MACALFTADLADFGTELADCTGEFASARHCTGRDATNLCALDIHFYAARHLGEVLFLEAGRRAVITSLGASEMHRWHRKREFEDGQVNFGEVWLIC